MPTRDRTVFFYMTRSAPYEKSKFLGSGGSMVARLKLKEIDGRAPQGVNAAAICSAPFDEARNLFIAPVSPDGQYTQIVGILDGDPQLTEVSSEVKRVWKVRLLSYNPTQVVVDLASVGACGLI